MPSSEVYLNVYDMNWINTYTAFVGLGIFHSGIQVYGKEYAYGSHPFPISGIFEITPRNASELGEQFKFRQQLYLGKTDFSFNDISKMVDHLGKKYRGDKYHLVHNNCNHFTSELAENLVGEEIPGWVNRLAKFGSFVSFLNSRFPLRWLSPSYIISYSNNSEENITVQ